MSRSLKIKKIAFCYLFSFFILYNNSYSEECAYEWIGPFDGSIKYIIPAFPDSNAAYWNYAVNLDELRTNEDFDALRISGRFPYARYMSFNMYYNNGQSEEVVSLTDFQIEPDPGSDNPYIPGVDHNTLNRNYSIWIVSENSNIADHANTIVIPENNDVCMIIYRVYKTDGQGIDGGVGTPFIEAYDEDTQSVVCLNDKPLDLPLGNLPINDEKLKKLFYFTDDDEISFYKLHTEGLAPNADNVYLTVSLGRTPHLNEVVVLNFIPPTHEVNGTFTGDKETRYWSFHLGGLILTGTGNGFCDDEARINNDGSVTVCIAPWKFQQAVENAGYNFIPWDLHADTIALLRHMLPAEDFIGSASNVPALSLKEIENTPEDLWDDLRNYYRAENWIGNYAPQGKRYSSIEFYCWLNNQQ